MQTTETSPTAYAIGAKVPRWLWPALKSLLIVAIVAAVGWQFISILLKPEFRERSFRVHPAGMSAAAALYIAGLGFPALYWHWLLHSLGQRPTLLSTLRAYYVGQLGRYVPGKVVGLGMRARLLAGSDVRTGAAVLTIVYETLTTLAAGVLLGLIVLAMRPAVSAAPSWRALALLAAVGCLAIPRVFNFLAERTSRPFRRPDAPPLPRVRGTLLAAGLAVAACGWLVQGGALYVVVIDVTDGAWPTPLQGWLYCSAYAGLAYAAGFLVLAAPAGIGVRDFLIQQFLAADLSRTMDPAQAAATAAAVALTMRLLWTVLDVAAAGVCYWMPGQANATEDHASDRLRAVKMQR
jgi:uncharacterized membrane protein YbhN (UPF0104 family)